MRSVLLWCRVVCYEEFTIYIYIYSTVQVATSSIRTAVKLVDHSWPIWLYNKVTYARAPALAQVNYHIITPPILTRTRKHETSATTLQQQPLPLRRSGVEL